MSQTGAYAYARQGYDYRQILGVYYPGVAIPQSGHLREREAGVEVILSL